MLFYLRKLLRRAVRHVSVMTTWGVLFAFAAVAVPGHGLHLLPGMGHFHGEADGSHAKTGQSALIAGCRGLQASSGDRDDDCPICHFLALDKVAPHLPVCVSCNATVTYLPTAEYAVLSKHCEQPFFARGPPEG